MEQGIQPSLREVFSLTLPQLGLMLCHLLISMTDMWVAGQIDSTVLASLGFISQLSAVLMLVISIAGSGCMATVSQALGAGLPQRAARYAGLILALSFCAGCLVAGMGLICLPLILRSGMVSTALAPVVAVFGTAYAVQLPFYYCMIMLNSVFRAHKLVWLPLATLVLVAAGNFTGSVGFGLGRWGLPDLGYAAVAWSTVVATLLGFGCNVALGLRRGLLGRAAFGSWRWNRIAAPRLWRIGAPAALGNLAAQAGNTVLLGCLAGLPQDAVAAMAGMTLGTRLLGFVLFPLSALGMTITILSGHLLGGRQAEAAYALGKRWALAASGCMALAALGIGIWREPIVRLFDDNGATVAQAGYFLCFACCTLPLQALAQILQAVLAGAGATRFICRIGCSSTWLITIPLALLLSRWILPGAGGVYIGITAGQLCMALWTLRVFRQKAWVRG